MLPMTPTPPRPDLYPLDETRNARVRWALDNVTIHLAGADRPFRQVLAAHLAATIEAHNKEVLYGPFGSLFTHEILNAGMLPKRVNPADGTPNADHGPETAAFTLAAIEALASAPAPALPGPCACQSAPDPYRVEALRLATLAVGRATDVDRFFPVIRAFADAYEQDLRDETAGATA